MATVLSHPAVPLGLALGLGTKTVPRALLAAGIAGSILPDADALGFWRGVPYESFMGHRGFTHSLVFALLAGATAALFASRLSARPDVTFFVVFVSTASHGCLDALTSGGLGIAFFSPFSEKRYFFPWRVLSVSPIGVRGLGGARGVAIFASEILWIWLPCLAAGLLGLLARRGRRPNRYFET